MTQHVPTQDEIAGGECYNCQRVYVTKSKMRVHRCDVAEHDWRDGDVVQFTVDKVQSSGPDIDKTITETHVAVRHDYSWPDGQWQVAIHGFWRVTDEFIDAHAPVKLVPE